MPTVSPSLARKIDALALKAQPDAVRVRRHLHRFPEVSWEEKETQAYLEAKLGDMGIEAQQVAGTGLFFDLGEGPEVVLYRADIDALPIIDGKEPGQSPCVSERPGVSHACGHDLHAAVAFGLAQALSGLGGRLPGRVRVVFQPAEEAVPSGALKVVEEGVADNIRAALALHADPSRDVGTVGLRVGAITSSSDRFSIHVFGEAGHSSRPHLARDAIIASAAIVRALDSVVSRRVDPMEPAVVAFGTIRGGQAENIIADAVTLAGSIRTFHPGTRAFLLAEVRRVAEAAARVHGCSVQVETRHGAPPVVNDPNLDTLVEKVAVELLGAGGVRRMPRPSSGSEDFSFFGRHAPAYMMRLGVRTQGGPDLRLHTSTFDLDEAAIGVGIRLMSRIVVEALCAKLPPAEI